MQILYALPAIVWAVVVTVLSLLPGNTFSPPPPLFGFIPVDVAGHLFCYWLLALFLMLAASKAVHWPRLRQFAGVYTISFVLVYGAVIELLQEYVAINRTFDWFDILANTMGGIIGFGIFKLFTGLLGKKPTAQ